jgi:triosephosphate isomerase
MHHLRTPVIAGNWKMYKQPADTTNFIEAFKPMVAGALHCHVVLAPAMINVPFAIGAAKGTNIEIAAQNVHWEKEGAFTGEVSPVMLASAGCKWVIIGHSERRQYFGETDETVLKKTLASLAVKLRPIVCIGETLAEREANQTFDVLDRQLTKGIFAIGAAQMETLVIAYEPVWAIGTGRTATPQQAQEVHAFIRKRMAEVLGEKVAEKTPVLYGGSVKPDNILGLMKNPDIDGALVGGASLDPVSFASIVHFDKPSAS